MEQLESDQTNEYELSQSMAAQPALLELADNNEDAAEIDVSGGSTDIDAKTNQENRSYGQLQEEEPRLQIKQQKNFGAADSIVPEPNGGLKYTRSIGRQSQNEDVKNLLATKYNTNQQLRAMPFNGNNNIQLTERFQQQQQPFNDADKQYNQEFLSANEQQQQQPAMSTKGRLLLDRLLFADYLNTLYAFNGPLDYNPIVVSPTSRILLGQNQPKAQARTLKASSSMKSKINSDKRQPPSFADSWTNNFYKNNHTVHLFALMAAILGACLAVKLVLKSSDKHLIRRNFSRFSQRSGSSFRSFWSNQSDDGSGQASATISGELESNEKDQKPLNRANFITRRFSTTSSANQNVDTDEMSNNTKATKSLDILTQKLIWLLRSQQKKCDDEVCKGNKKRDRLIKRGSNDDEIIEVDSVSTGSTQNAMILSNNNDDDDLTESVGNNGADNNGQFRSSRSYIKSLIDVLSQARSHMPSVSQFGGYSSSKIGLVVEDDDDVSDHLPAKIVESDCASLNNGNSELQLDEAGIVMSQMDISAAHLILTYMEKHLEDKERLKREWLELNSSSNSIKQHHSRQTFAATAAGSGSGGTGSSLVGLADGGGANKIKQLMLQRLAKVALNDENKAKNRNPLAVPFDRNRVRLFSGPIPASPSYNSSNNSNSSLSPTSSFGGNSSTGNAGPLQTFSKLHGSNNKKTNNNNGKRGSKLQQHRQSDYINASYIYDDDPRTPTHIIAQGPSEETAGQFWQVRININLSLSLETHTRN